MAWDDTMGLTLHTIPPKTKKRKLERMSMPGVDGSEKVAENMTSDWLRRRMDKLRKQMESGDPKARRRLDDTYIRYEEMGEDYTDAFPFK